MEVAEVPSGSVRSHPSAKGVKTETSREASRWRVALSPIALSAGVRASAAASSRLRVHSRGGGVTRSYLTHQATLEMK